MNFGDNFFDFGSSDFNINENEDISITKTQNEFDRIFDGTLDSAYDNIYRYLFSDELDKALEFIEYIESTKPNIDVSEFKLHAMSILEARQIKEAGSIAKYVMKKAKENKLSMNQICELFAQASSHLYAFGVYIERKHAAEKLFSEYFNDLTCYNELLEEKESLEASNNYNSNNYEKNPRYIQAQAKISQLELKYSEISIVLNESETFANKYIEIYDIDHIMTRNNDVALYCSNWLDEAYKEFIDRAIILHKLPQLKQLYPNPQQKKASRQMIQKVMVSKMRDAYNNLSNVNRQIMLCRNKIEKIKQMNGNSVVTKSNIGMTVALGLLNPVLAVGNVVRSGYSWYNNNQKLEEARAELNSELSNIDKEAERLYSDIVITTTELSEDIKTNIADKYFKGAVLDLLNKLKKNNIEPLPVERYFW